MSFSSREVLSSVHHIQDCMGVCMTLLIGTRQALLIDTGYGVEDVQAFIRTLTELPVTVMITHGHHDHCMGAKWFEETWMFAQDQADFNTYTGRDTRQHIADSARAKGIAIDVEAYLNDQVAIPKPLSAQTIDLGDMTVQIIPCPGHTPGSFAAYVPERELLLTGDDWNPCTWLFFPAALDVFTYQKNVGQLLSLPFSHVLCSHQPMLFERSRFEDFLTGLRSSSIDEARAVTIPPYLDIRTVQLEPAEGQIIVFDYDKALRMRSGGC